MWMYSCFSNAAVDLALRQVHGFEKTAVELAISVCKSGWLWPVFLPNSAEIPKARRKRFGSRQPTGGLEQYRQVVEPIGDVGVIGPKLASSMVRDCRIKGSTSR